ncbi:MAG: mannose-6-phosphate isomerase, class I [Kiritimatiellae bacterium]|nr:mannose-6-phosphate isomerase, class I [Kiritimatiellia bacterium]
MARLRNPVQDYAWGSTAAIPALLGEPNPGRKPQAELWMGTHPKGPSDVLWDGAWMPLADLIARQPDAILGPAVAARFGGKLPFLFKVLAAAQPLSIQAHPNREQAEAGYARENELGIPLDAPRRNYRDPNHKPETICALTPFWALRGFRVLREILAYFNRLGTKAFADEVHALGNTLKPAGLRRFFEAIMTAERERQQLAVAQAAKNAEIMREKDPVFDWVVKLNEQYPGDIGVLFPALLNLVCLQPGEAMFLPAGELHAYLDGVGMELMANSDNVLRGGLTPKHMDVPELLKTLSFASGRVDILTPETRPNGERLYPRRAAEFALSAVRPEPGTPCLSPADRSVEIMIGIEGTGRITEEPGGGSVQMGQGVSVLIPAAVPRYRLEGAGLFYKAGVPPEEGNG